MKSIIALFVAAVLAEETTAAVDTPAAEEEAVATNWMGMYIPTATDAPSVMMSNVAGKTMFMGQGQKKNTWFGLAWGGSGDDNMTKADFLWIKTNDNENAEVKDMWSQSSGAWDQSKPTEDGTTQSWTKDASTMNADGNTVDWIASYTAPAADAADAKDIAAPCGTAAEGEVAAVNAVFQVEWFSNPTSNDINNVWTAEGDFHVETDALCAVVWWSDGERPVVVAGAQALAAAATVAFTALYL